MSDAATRKTMAALASICHRTGCNIWWIRHLVKTNTQQRAASADSAAQLGSGSVALTGTARAQILILLDPADEDRERRLVYLVKANYTNWRKTPPHAFVVSFRAEVSTPFCELVPCAAGPVDETLRAAAAKAREQQKEKALDARSARASQQQDQIRDSLLMAFRSAPGYQLMSADIVKVYQTAGKKNYAAPSDWSGWSTFRESHLAVEPVKTSRGQIRIFTLKPSSNPEEAP